MRNSFPLEKLVNDPSPATGRTQTVLMDLSLSEPQPAKPLPPLPAHSCLQPSPRLCHRIPKRSNQTDGQHEWGLTHGLAAVQVVVAIGFGPEVTLKCSGMSLMAGIFYVLGAWVCVCRRHGDFFVGLSEEKWSTFGADAWVTSAGYCSVHTSCSVLSQPMPCRDASLGCSA